MATRDEKKHCGMCKSAGHSSRTCGMAAEPSLKRTAEVLDQLFGKDREKAERAEERYKPTARHRILFAPRGPRYLADGSYAQPYRFSSKFIMLQDGSVTHMLMHTRALANREVACA